jgi:hypothetical protein
MINQKTNQEDQLERLAALEHEQWIEWSQQIAKTENISEKRLHRWHDLWVPYEDLPEETKEDDRIYARQVLEELSRTREFAHVHDGDVVEVVWLDAGLKDHILWHELEELSDPEPTVSWGLVFRRTKKYLHLLHNVDMAGCDGSTVFYIPLGMVQEIRVLVRRSSVARHVKLTNSVMSTGSAMDCLAHDRERHEPESRSKAGSETDKHTLVDASEGKT